jgi:nicotinamidase-related amidase
MDSMNQAVPADRQPVTARRTSPLTLADFAGVKRVPSDWSKAALLLVDPQREYVSGKVPLAGIKEAIAACRKLVDMARRANAPVIHIHHHGKPGGALFDPHLDGVKSIPELESLPGDSIVIKGLPNAFAATHLHAHLQTLGRNQLVIAGFATHMCVSATARSALDHGYSSTVVASACATRDLPDPVTGEVVPASELHRACLGGLHDRFALVVRNPSAWAA